MEKERKTAESEPSWSRAEYYSARDGEVEEYPELANSVESFSSNLADALAAGKTAVAWAGYGAGGGVLTVYDCGVTEAYGWTVRLVLGRNKLWFAVDAGMTLTGLVHDLSVWLSTEREAWQRPFYHAPIPGWPPYPPSRVAESAASLYREAFLNTWGETGLPVKGTPTEKAAEEDAPRKPRRKRKKGPEP